MRESRIAIKEVGNNKKNKKMSTKEVKKKERGRLFWLIPILEIISIIAYLVIGFGGLMNAVSNFDFAGMFNSVIGAMVFLIITTAIITILCFLPAFKSKGNVRWAIWNIIWIILTIYGIM